jgi:[acyl-carrier-protein] S-malonyltransferase
MAALLGLDETAAAQVCADAGAELCNLNAPGQIVIGGALPALERARALALERGAKRAIKLDVGGAFHTSLMEPAVAGMREALAETDVRPPAARFVANDRAAPIDDPDAIREELAHQLTHPVRWVQCVEYMAAQGVTTFIEIGPGRVLSGLVKRIAPEAATRNINGLAAVSP